MLKPGDEITVVTRDGKSTIRATVRGFYSDKASAAARIVWDTSWLASGYCYEDDEGVTWVSGYVEESACRALLVAYSLLEHVRGRSEGLLRIGKDQ
jgi:hypothetical protein